jgi:hypothetical protein
VIVLLGLMDIHSFSGEERGLYVLAKGPAGEFRFQISEDQAATLLANASPHSGSMPQEAQEEDANDEEEAEAPPTFRPIPKFSHPDDEGDEAPVKIPRSYKMGTPQKHLLVDDEDDL